LLFNNKQTDEAVKDSSGQWRFEGYLKSSTAIGAAEQISVPD